VLLGVTALVVDLGRARHVRAQLQTAADSAALAAAYALPDEAAVQALAEEYADYNNAEGGQITSPSDIVLGHWDESTATFTAGALPANAVQVVTRRSDTYGNPVTNVFASVMGFGETNVSAIAITAKKRSVIDFEGLAEGEQPTEVSWGNGISGDEVNGTVYIEGRGGYGPMVFQGLCLPPGSNDPADAAQVWCTGGDHDLWAPGQGNIIIVSENGDGTDGPSPTDGPDDNGNCPNGSSPPAVVHQPSDVPDNSQTRCTIIFDFRDFGSGTVNVSDVTLVDVEEDAFVWLYRDGQLIAEVALQEAGDGNVEIRPVPGTPAADIMIVKFQGSGAVDNVGYSEVVTLVG
jgi:hypothetical protein